jgi:hypothetical protein
MIRNHEKTHEDISFLVGDLVMIQTKNLRIRLSSKKLAPRFIGPYRIKDVVGTQAYRLWLPPYHKFHPVFNVSRLEKYNPRDPDRSEFTTDSIVIEGEEQWEVDRILSKRKRNGILEYLVRWVGFDDEWNQWVEADHMRADEAIQEYENSVKNRGMSRPSGRGRGRPRRG